MTKAIKKLLFTLFFLGCSLVLFCQPMSGTYSIGTAPSAYTTLTAAFSALGTRGVNGPVILELKNGYAYEGTTIFTSAVAGSSRTNTITIRPAAGSSLITLRNVSNTTSGVVFNFDGSLDNVIIDGRPGGTGSSRGLRLISEQGGSPVILGYGDAQNITIRNCMISGNNNNSSNGLLNITSTNLTNGNDKWTITENEFVGYGLDAANNPIGSNNMIYITGVVGAEHDSLTITNNIFRDMYCPTNLPFNHNAMVLGSGIRVATVTGNAIYMTEPRAYNFGSTAQTWVGIRVSNGNNSCTKFTIANNYIGGSNSTAGGLATRLSGKVIFRGIEAGVPAGDTIRIYNNVITNINMNTDTAASGSSMFIGINVLGNGSAKIGVDGPNTIGSITTANAIVINNNTTQVDNALIVGINASDTGSTYIRNNRIGGITTSATNTNRFMNVYGINFSGAILGREVEITDNIIGSTTVANSINVTNGLHASSQFNVRGINASVTTGATVPNFNIIGNTIANIRFAPATISPAASIGGIFASPGNISATRFNVSSNTIYNIAGATDRSNASISIAVYGITFHNSNATAATSQPVVSNNIIYGLTNTSTTVFNNSSVSSVAGIVFSNAIASPTVSFCYGNLIHSLNTMSSYTTGGVPPPLTGIINNSVGLRATNNIIRLGLDTNGVAMTNAVDIRGYFKNNSHPTNFSHNTVYIAGTGVADGTAATTACINRITASVNDTIANNILINKRSNANTTGGGRHYAIRISNNPTQMSYVGYNLYFANGTGGFVGTANGGTSDMATLTAWRSALPADNYSGYGDVTFTNADGNKTALNLTPTSAVNLFGAAIPTVTTDFSNTSRSATIPTIGAYELTSKSGVWKANAATTSWTTASNWESNSVPSPTGGVSIFIPANTLNVPVVSTNVTVGRLVNATTQPLTVNNNITLTLRGELITADNTGTVNATGATLRFAGTQHQTIGGTVNVANLQIDNAGGVGISGMVNLIGTLTPVNGSLAANGRLLLISNQNGTAIVASGIGIITGNVIAQRYIPAKPARKSLFLGSPVTARIDTSWQRQIHITGVIGVCPATGTGGFDATVSGNPSMFTYNAANISGQRWVSIANTNATSLTPSTGYRVVIRGNKADGCILTDGSTQPVSAVTLQANGILAQGDIARNLNEEFNFIANPYQSPINFNSLASDNSSYIDATYWTYNPENANGVFSVYNAGTLTNKPFGFSNDNIITIGQAFFVRKNTSGSTNISNFFRESQKSTTAQTGLFRIPNWQRFTRIALKEGFDKHLDETVIRFGTNADINNLQIGRFDALNISDAFEGISSLKGEKELSIQTRHHIQSNDTINLFVKSSKTGIFKLYFDEFNDDNATLIDKFLNTQTAIKEKDTYAFSITDMQESKGNRFSIVFSNSVTLPTEFIKVDVKLNGNNSGIINWTIANDLQVAKYEVEKSINGISYETIGTIVSKKNSNSIDYSFIDSSIKETQFYRIKAIALDGKFKYSIALKLDNISLQNDVSIFPIPVTNHLNIQLLRRIEGKIKATIINSSGKVLHEQIINNTNLNNTTTLDLSKLNKGGYQLILSNDSDYYKVHSFVK